MQEVRFALRKSAMADQTEYRIVFPNSVTIDTANILRSRIVGALSQQDFGSLTILFSSEGGSTDQGGSGLQEVLSDVTMGHGIALAKEVRDPNFQCIAMRHDRYVLAWASPIRAIIAQRTATIAYKPQGLYY